MSACARIVADGRAAHEIKTFGTSTRELEGMAAWPGSTAARPSIATRREALDWWGRELLSIVVGEPEKYGTGAALAEAPAR